MKRQFSMSTVFRMTEKALLRQFFESFGVKMDSVCWDDINRRHIELLEKVFDDMPPNERDRAEVALRNIHALACDKGMEALDEAAESLQAGRAWNKDSFFGKNLYSRSMAAWLDHREIFEEAIKYFEADSRAWWRKRVDLPKITPVLTEESLENMEGEIALLLKTTQGRGYACTVEMVSRPNGKYYFFAHPDDYVRDALVHDENNDLVHQAIRQTFEVVFAYDSIDGSSELSARLPQRVKESLEAIFLRHVLGVEPEKEEEKPFDLSMLLDRNFDLTVRPEDRIKVGVTSLTLKWTGECSVCTTTKYPDSAREFAFKHIAKDWLSRPDLTVSRVRFRFEFQSTGEGRSRFLSFDIGAPFYCTLKNQHPALEEIIHRYLKEWRIEHDPNENAAFGGNNEVVAFVGARKRA